MSDANGAGSSWGNFLRHRGVINPALWAWSGFSLRFRRSLRHAVGPRCHYHDEAPGRGVRGARLQVKQASAIGGLMLVAMTASAGAADTIRYDWTGFYFGGHVGYTRGRTDATLREPEITGA